MSNGWKVFAIILLIILVLETILVCLLYGVGSDVIEKENKCGINICLNGDYDSYIYDQVNNICYCYTDGVEGYVYSEVVE